MCFAISIQPSYKLTCVSLLPLPMQNEPISFHGFSYTSSVLVFGATQHHRVTASTGFAFSSWFGSLCLDSLDHVRSCNVLLWGVACQGWLSLTTGLGPAALPPGTADLGIFGFAVCKTLFLINVKGRLKKIKQRKGKILPPFGWKSIFMTAEWIICKKCVSHSMLQVHASRTCLYL